MKLINWQVGLIPLIFASSVLLPTTSVFACDTNLPPKPQIAFKQSTRVFIGKVLSIQPDPNERGSLVVKFAVRHEWKGDKQTRITVNTNSDDAGCGYNFSLGKKYLVYATRNINRSFTSTASRTNELALVKPAEIKALGKGYALQ
jgi:hypothetical protein